MAPASDNQAGAWAEVIVAAHGHQAHLERAWRCDPAWDVSAVQREADDVLAIQRGERILFRDRHIDRRFEIAYPRSAAEAPRTLSATFADAAADWRAVREHVDRYLADAGLSEASPAEDVARCLADTFKADSYFKDKPSCVMFGEPTRALMHPVEGLLHQSFCVGCAHGFAAMADMAGLSCRTVGCGAHRVAEVLVDGRWRMVENSCRRADCRDLEALMPASFMEVTLHPERWPDHVPARKRDGYRAMPSGQYHFMGGRWQSPPTLRFAAGNARALYPELTSWTFKSYAGLRVPLVANASGFYWEDAPVETEAIGRAVAARRAAAMPFDVDEPIVSDYLFAPLPPGATLRQTVWLGEVDDVTGLEIVTPLPPNVDASAGEQFTLSVNGAARSLAAWGAWPARARRRGMLAVTVTAPADMLRAHAVNQVELRNGGVSAVMMPFVPAAMEPYVPPLRPG